MAQINPDLPTNLGDDGVWGTILNDALAEMVAQGNATDIDAVKVVGGRKYRIVAGVIRNPGGPGYWELIADANHRAANVDAVTTLASVVRVNYASLGVTRVVSFVAVADERLSRAGIRVGTSVSPTEATLYFNRTQALSDYVSYNGTTWVSASGVYAASFAAGVLTLTHADLLGVDTNAFGVSLTPRGGPLRPVVNPGSPGTSRTQVGIQFLDAAGAVVNAATTDMKVFVTRGTTESDTANINPQLITETMYPNSNIWFLGIFEVA